MKRVTQLRKLSSDHHLALVLAKRAKRAASGDDRDQQRELAEEIVAKFPHELEPHFLLEEEYLLEPLRKYGEFALVEQLIAEHAELRKLITNTDNQQHFLSQFGTALERHVRFEERELFVVVQGKFSQDELDALNLAGE